LLLLLLLLMLLLLLLMLLMLLLLAMLLFDLTLCAVRLGRFRPHSLLLAQQHRQTFSGMNISLS